ncbi:MAG: dipicolinate synthase subunit B [Firmicutes bacterium]|nr:dipicolinate synthase subunit B [Bacillota bacterium]
MKLNSVRVGFGVTGSHCTLKRVFDVADRLVKEYGADLYPIFSESVWKTDTRFGTASHWQGRIKEITDRDIIHTIKDAEPIGPKSLLDVMVIAPASGNTIGKLVNGVVDSPVLMAAKAHLRNGGPLVVAVSTNDGLGMSGKNIGMLCNVRNVFMVPFGQDDPLHKPNSLVAKMEMIPETVISSLNRKQIQPILIEY